MRKSLVKVHKNAKRFFEHHSNHNRKSLCASVLPQSYKKASKSLKIYISQSHGRKAKKKSPINFWTFCEHCVEVFCGFVERFVNFETAPLHNSELTCQTQFLLNFRLSSQFFLPQLTKSVNLYDWACIFWEFDRSESKRKIRIETENINRIIVRNNISSRINFLSCHSLVNLFFLRRTTPPQ